MRRALIPILAVWVAAVLLPAVALAQSNSNIAGVVKDATGAVLPGVTVEAASPSLIEKVRTVVTDSAGQYKIINLVPGTYAVTFSLQGFNTVRREGIELTASFTANISVDLRVGSLEETIFRMSGGRRIQANMDLFNLFNVSAVLAQNNTYGSSWLRPTTIVQGRLLKFGGQIDF